ncbi:MAG: porin family protein [Rhodanobacteraceae bacterium]|nr:porin family protein [Rhodanobacteraceae bacterium]
MNQGIFAMHAFSRLVPAVLLGLTGFAASAADAPAAYYLGGRVSFDEVSDLTVDAGPILGDLELDTGWGFCAVAGRRIGDPWRLELEWMRHTTDAEALPALALEDLGGSVDVNTLMLNLIADLPLEGSSWVPHLGAGAGWASVKLDDLRGDFLRISGEDDSTWALQAIAGVAVPLGDSLILDLDARYTHVSADHLGYEVEGVSFDGGDSDVQTVSLTAGLRFDL